MFYLSLFIFAASLLGGCSVFSPSQDEAAIVTHRPYISEISLPEAKAAFGYAQFRMLIIENRWEEGIEALERALAFDPQSEKLQLTLAKAYLHNQQFDEGAQALETLLTLYPENLSGRELLGDLRVFQERFSDAVAAYLLVLDKAPGNEKLRLRLITVYDQQQDLPKALLEAKRLLRLNPDSIAGRLTLARLQRQNSQADAAIKTYRDLLIRRPSQLRTILELGQFLEQEQQVDKAIDLYRQSLKGNPELLAIYKQLARILILQERYTEALQLLQQAHQQRPEDQQILNRIGLLQLSREDYPGAEKTFRKMLTVKADLPRSHYSLSMALMGQKRNQDALIELDKIPENSDVYAEAILQRSYLYRQEGDIEQAIQLLQGVIDAGNPSLDVYYYLSAFLGEADRLAAAGRIVRQGIEQFPDDPRLHYRLGVIYEQMDDRAQALAEMKQVLILEPQHADALNFVAYHYAELGENLEQALAMAKLALGQKESSYIYDTLGWIYYRMNGYVDALDYLNKAVSLAPDDPLILEHLGDAYAAQRRWRDAEQSYRKSLKFDKTAVEVDFKLQKLLKDHSAQ